MTGNESPVSQLAHQASELAREILGARATGDEDLLVRAISIAMANMVVEPDLFPLVLGAQAYLTWTALSAAPVDELGPDSTAEHLDRERRDRVAVLCQSVALAGPSL